MNSKKAKALRKLVRNLQKQQGELPVHEFITVKNTAKDVMVQKSGEDGEVGVEKLHVFDGQKRVAPRSQRAVYLHLKKEMEKIEDSRRK